ncbi:MAG: hypothetical protein JXA82_02475 [Sedimentisphaerales bacterium]|nr:hypothetical protein [Sedimentisphaerales bacterium]
MNKSFEETVAMSKDTSFYQLWLAPNDMPETSGTLMIKFEAIKDLCSNVPLRQNRRCWRLPAIPFFSGEETGLTTMMMNQAQDVFEEVWSDPADDVWDNL